MDFVECSTQAEVDRVTAAGDVAIVRSGFYRASDSASVEAYDSASVRASGSASVRASKFVVVTRYGTTAKVDGGVLIQIPAVDTIEEWADFYGLAVEDGEVVVFKAVDDGLKSGYAMEYPIGGEVSAPDWDGATSCGGGLHFCARPFIAARYFGDATRYLACAVKVADAVVVASWDQRPSDKIKAASCRVIHEVDIDGHALESTQGGQHGV